MSSSDSRDLNQIASDTRQLFLLSYPSYDDQKRCFPALEEVVKCARTNFPNCEYLSRQLANCAIIAGLTEVKKG